MEIISFREGEGATYGGVDIVISLTPEQAAAMPELGPLADAMAGALRALAALRTGSDADDPDAWRTAIHDVDQRLLPRIAGIRDASVRAHTEAGGSVADLARAMGGVSRSTAQYRREVLQRSTPSDWEAWAVTGTQPRR